MSRNPIAKAARALADFVIHLSRWTRQIVLSSIILGILFFIVTNFYIFSSIVNLDSFFYIFLILSLLTDGLFIFIHLPRRRTNHKTTSFDPSKLTIVIACYNGAEIITKTIKEAAVHVPLQQILVVSDASTDDTVKVAQSMGVRVLNNRQNLNKAFSISRAMRYVQTPYVLLLDDDTFIGKTDIPTSLLDDGYTAVAFNVMPTAKKTLVNELQRFEYRNSMQIGKNLRAGAGAIGNISGAIGLYRTADLQRQVPLHSGQFAGEDEQRTILAHMYGTGKGITYTDSLVLTDPPGSWYQLYRQRAYSWSLAVPELFSLYWHVLLSPRYHYLLKAEKAYQMYIYLTDPLRMLFFWALVLKPSHFAVTYAFYLALDIIIWLRTGRHDSFRAVLFSPIYTVGLALCRFIGHFYWLKVKSQYLFKRYHRFVPGRKLLAEYLLVVSVISLSWYFSAAHFMDDIQLFNKIRTYRLEETTKQFNYDSDQPASQIVAPIVTPAVSVPYYEVLVEKGDSARALATKALDQYLIDNRQLTANDSQRLATANALAIGLTATTYEPGSTVKINKAQIAQVLSEEGVK